MTTEKCTTEWVPISDYQTLERERDELKRRLNKLKRLVLLTDQSLACLEMQSMNITIWGEYCKAYPDECEIASLGVTP